MQQRAEQAHLRREEELAAAQRCARDAQERAEGAERAAERATLALRVAERTAHLQHLADLAAARQHAQAAADALPELPPRTVAALRELAAAHREACVQRDAAATAVVFTAERAVTARWLAEGRTEAAEVPPGGTLAGRTSGLGELHLAGIGTVREMDDRARPHDVQIREIAVKRSFLAEVGRQGPSAAERNRPPAQP